MALNHIVISKVGLSTSRNNHRTTRSKTEPARKCDVCRCPSERRYLIAQDLWVCLACVPKEVLTQYPGWAIR